MRYKLMWLIGVGALVVFAYAQISGSVRGATGAGLAGLPDAETPNARFSFHVGAATFNNQTRMHGNFAIAVRGEQSLTDITLRELRRLEVNTENGTATFSGPAVLSSRSRSGSQRTPGVVVVRVADNRGPRDTEGDPDTIGVAFYTNPDADPVFTYRGVVKRGDIKVFSRSR